MAQKIPFVPKKRSERLTLKDAAEQVGVGGIIGYHGLYSGDTRPRVMCKVTAIEDGWIDTVGVYNSAVGVQRRSYTADICWSAQAQAGSKKFPPRIQKRCTDCQNVVGYAYIDDGFPVICDQCAPK